MGHKSGTPSHVKQQPCFWLAVALCKPGDVEALACVATCCNVCVRCFTPCPSNNVSDSDQAIHNYIVHFLKPMRPDLLHFEALQVQNDESPIYTLTVVHPPRIEVMNDDFAVYNRKGVRPPVLHQVDRKEALLKNWDVFALDHSVKRMHMRRLLA